VGAAGQVLNNLLNKLGLPREEVYITNVVKSRPPENRDPEPDEIEACLPYLKRQIAAIRRSSSPGRLPQALLGSEPITRITGSGSAMTISGDAHHPSYLLGFRKAQNLGGRA
jgi:DNA polymerase